MNGPLLTVAVVLLMLLFGAMVVRRNRHALDPAVPAPKEDEGGLASWRRPLLIVAATAPIGILLFSIAMMATSELAFEDGRCPYDDDGEVRVIETGVAVREDVRRCEEGVEEHRWVLLRNGEAPEEIGRRRLRAELFGDGARWEAELDDAGYVRLTIHNPGLAPRLFKEPGPDGSVGRRPPGST